MLPGMSPLVQFLARSALGGVSVLIVAAILPGMRVRGYFDAFAFAVVVGVLNALAFEVFGILTIPFSILTVGFGYVAINALIFLLAQKVVRGVEISGCVIAALAALLVGLVNSAIARLIH